MTHSDLTPPPTAAGPTPGPWVAVPGSDGCDLTWDIQAPAAGTTVAAVAYWPDEAAAGPAARAAADARLLAAAPELAACLRELLDPVAGLLLALRDDRVRRARRRARRVLAAVDGES